MDVGYVDGDVVNVDVCFEYDVNVGFWNLEVRIDDDIVIDVIKICV